MSREILAVKTLELIELCISKGMEISFDECQYFRDGQHFSIFLKDHVEEILYESERIATPPTHNMIDEIVKIQNFIDKQPRI
jgi:hypothetical protein